MPWHSSWRWSTTLRILDYTLWALRASQSAQTLVGRRRRWTAERAEAVSAPSVSVLAAHWAALVGVRPVRRAPGRYENALRRSSGPFERSTRCMLQPTAPTPPCAFCVALGVRPEITGGATVQFEGWAVWSPGTPAGWFLCPIKNHHGDGLIVACLDEPLPTQRAAA